MVGSSLKCVSSVCRISDMSIGLGRRSGDLARRSGDPGWGRADLVVVGRPSQESGDPATSTLVAHRWSLTCFEPVFIHFWYLHPNIHVHLVKLISSRG